VNVATKLNSQFRETIWNYYHNHGRHDLPWRIANARGAFDPYAILVSEFMLQQTQVARVIPKYRCFLAQFPTYDALAKAPLGDVLRAWQGLGYNRRAKYLWQTARELHKTKQFPRTQAELTQFPGVGPNTAGAILAYAFNVPSIFIETNIRTVYLHHFFRNEKNVSDTHIREAVAATLDHEHPREFYWAVMDYGTFLKTQIKNNTQSKHYTKQSKFEGSRREIRGKILRRLSVGRATYVQLADSITDQRLSGVLEDLIAEDMIVKKHSYYQLQ